MRINDSNLFLKNHHEDRYKHPFHLVEPSDLPMFMSIAVFNIIVSVILKVHYKCIICFEPIFSCPGFVVTITAYRFEFLWFVLSGFLLFSYIFFSWFQDVIHEGYEGYHTQWVLNGLRMGMVLFIVSEIMFFFSFFLSYFYYSLQPSVFLSCSWPPRGLEIIPYNGLPLLNTALLLYSGLVITQAHMIMGTSIKKYWDEVPSKLFEVILVGVAFVFCQYTEYVEAKFTMQDSVYGSIFFLATGFHGIHVIIGLAFILVCNLRLLRKDFTKKDHVALESSIWYWHFVDVVWLFLFVIVYWWGGSKAEMLDDSVVSSHVSEIINLTK